MQFKEEMETSLKCEDREMEQSNKKSQSMY